MKEAERGNGREKRKRRVGGARDEGGGAGVLERGTGDKSTLTVQRCNSLGAMHAFLCQDSQTQTSKGGNQTDNDL